MIVSIIGTLVVVGLILWVVSLLPIDPTITRIIHALVIVAVVLWLLVGFGLLRMPSGLGWR